MSWSNSENNQRSIPGERRLGEVELSWECEARGQCGRVASGTSSVGMSANGVA